MQHSATHDINTSNKIPLPTLRRLPWYLAYISRLASQDIENVSSTAISREINVDASQIAKDLSFLGVKGKTRIGYNVRDLAERLEYYLGYKRSHKAVIIGVGSLGTALLSDKGLERFGLQIVAGIDKDESLIGSYVGNVPVLSPESLATTVKDLNVEIGIIAVPAEHAQNVADLLVDANVSAIWNFAPCRIVCRDNVIVQDTSIYTQLAVMYHKLSILEEQK